MLLSHRSSHKKYIHLFIYCAHPDRQSFQLVLSCNWLNGYNNHHVLSTYSDNYKWFLSTRYPLHDNVLTFIRCFNLGLVGQHQCMEKVSRPFNSNPYFVMVTFGQPCLCYLPKNVCK